MDNLLSSGELANYFNVTMQTVYSWRKRPDPIPFIKIGYRSIRYNMIDVVDWLDRNKITGDDKEQL